MRLLHSLEYLTVAALALAVTLQMWAFVSNFRFWLRQKTVLPSTRLLVIVAHQDDETAVAGGALIQAGKFGAQIRVVYTMDGATRKLFPVDEVRRVRIAQRENEALMALQLVGIKASWVTFLRHENQIGLREPIGAIQAVKQIAAIIREFQPDRILIPAFEGGHIDHDLTHYLAMCAGRIVSYPRDHIFEAPEYNNYYLIEWVKQKLRFVLLSPLYCPPRCLPLGVQPCVLQMSRKEMELKRDMLRCFATCNPSQLLKRFEYPDIFRQVPEYNYTTAPFNPTETWLHQIRSLRFLRKTSLGPFYPPDLTTRDYDTCFSLLNKSLSLDKQ